VEIFETIIHFKAKKARRAKNTQNTMLSSLPKIGCEFYMLNSFLKPGNFDSEPRLTGISYFHSVTSQLHFPHNENGQ
jgi:hypothetical protein